MHAEKTSLAVVFGNALTCSVVNGKRIRASSLSAAGAEKQSTAVNSVRARVGKWVTDSGAVRVLTRTRVVRRNPIQRSTRTLCRMPLGTLKRLRRFQVCLTRRVKCQGTTHIR